MLEDFVKREFNTALRQARRPPRVSLPYRDLLEASGLATRIKGSVVGKLSPGEVSLCGDISIR